MRTSFLTLAIAAVICVGCGGGSEPAEEAPDTATAAEAEAPPSAMPPAMIVTERGGFIPEGIEYDATGRRFLTGSLSEGTIFEIGEDGSVTPVVTDPDLVSSVGIEVDEARNRLLVCNSDRAVFDGSASGQAKLGVYDLASGERVAMVDLAAAIPDAPDDAAYFANDVAVGDDGTAYVTDSRMGVIYAVGTDYQASIVHTFDPSAEVALNGIEYHPSGYLLVASGATLFKVPLDDPGATTEVTLPETIAGQDGVVWTGDGRLAIVSNSESRVVALTSADDWATAEVAGVAPYDVQATTAAAVGDDIYVIHPHFNDADPPSVEHVTFQ